MRNATQRIRNLLVAALVCAVFPELWADGGYVTKTESVAVSVDQRAILIKNGNQISMTLSTGYTGDGEDFGWIIPTPVPPAIEDVSEAGENGQAAFDILGKHTAPAVFKTSGCFPAGTEVLTAQGPRSIETTSPGATVQSYDLTTGKWVLKSVLKRPTHQYSGDMITILLGTTTIRATGNHPFYVVQGERLASRPLPQDVPEAEQQTMGDGRWVEARHLTEGDVLLDKAGGGLTVTAVSSRHENIEVYNLEVDGCHNYAVHRKGILVHNKAGAEGPAVSLKPVTVYGMSTLEHYDVSVLGAGSAAALLRWLRQNDYHVDPNSRKVLDDYIDRHWAFVAAKLNLDEKRRYENEFLPPLTIQYQHDQLVFPLRISSVSTTHPARITLYVIAESTVESSNFPTRNLNYDERLYEPVSPRVYAESCIRSTFGDDREVSGAEDSRGLVVTWSGKFTPSADEQKIIEELAKSGFPDSSRSYLTHLMARMGRGAMSDDVDLVLDPQPKEFRANFVFIGSWWTGEAPKARENEGVTELMYAALDETETDWVTSLLKAGADVNARNGEGWSAVFYAARNPNPGVISTLLKAGADVDLQDRHGCSALMHVATQGHADAVRTLLKVGADVNLKDEIGWTALMRAAANGHAEVVKILLQAGTDKDASNKYGSTALMLAAKKGYTEVMKILLEAGADVDARDDSGETTLYQIVSTPRFASFGPDFPKIATILLQAGADVEARSKARWTSLMKAASEGDAEVVKILLQAGAAMEAKNSLGLTALLLAAQYGKTKAAQVLIEAGANVNARGYSGDTVLSIAKKYGSTQIVELLRKTGATE